jgi:hypothetical protein
MQIRRIFCTLGAALAFGQVAYGQALLNEVPDGTIITMAPATPVAPPVVVPSTPPITDIDGRVGDQYSRPGSKDAQMFFKPASAAEKNLLIENVRVHDVTNQKALDINANRFTGGKDWAYENITVRNYTAENVWRTANADSGIANEGLHIDFLRIAGGANQDVKTNVNLENVTIKNGDALPLLIQDGEYGTIHLKNILLEGTKHQEVQISTLGSGTIDKIVVEDSPGLHLNVMGRPGTIGEIEFVNSDGADYDLREWTPVRATVAPVPEPGIVALLVPAVALLAKRRKRA